MFFSLPAVLFAILLTALCAGVISAYHTAVLGRAARELARNQKQVNDKLDVIHDLVNSRLSSALKEIAVLKTLLSAEHPHSVKLEVAAIGARVDAGTDGK